MRASWCSGRAERSCATSRRSCPRSGKRPSSRRPSATSPPRQRSGPRNRWRFVGSKETPAWASSFGAPSRAGAGPWRKTSACACASPGRPWTGNGSMILSPPSSLDPPPTSRAGWHCEPRLVSEARTAFRSSGRLGADEAWFEGELTSSEEFGSLVDTLWPSVSPNTLVRDLLSSREQLERYALRPLRPRGGGSCSFGAVARPSAPRPGAPTTWRCSTRRRSSREAAPAPTATSWWTRPRI